MDSNNDIKTINCVELDVTNKATIISNTHEQSHPIENIKSFDLMEYWQSEGDLPHLIDFIFPSKLKINFINFYLDPLSDKSFCLKEVLVRIIRLNDYEDLCRFELKSKIGWQKFQLCQAENKLNTSFDIEGITCEHLQLVILSNYEQGRNSRIRQVRLTQLAVKNRPGYTNNINPKEDKKEYKTTEFIYYSRFR